MSLQTLDNIITLLLVQGQFQPKQSFPKQPKDLKKNSLNLGTKLYLGNKLSLEIYPKQWKTKRFPHFENPKQTYNIMYLQNKILKI